MTETKTVNEALVEIYTEYFEGLSDEELKCEVDDGTQISIERLRQLLINSCLQLWYPNDASLGFGNAQAMEDAVIVSHETELGKKILDTLSKYHYVELATDPSPQVRKLAHCGRCN